MTFKEYVHYKLSLKLNLVVRSGKSSTGIISPFVIESLSKEVSQYGYYLIFYDQGSFPSFLRWVDVIDREISPAQWIHFSKQEHREFKLRQILT